jgi:hypothetical protein
MMQIENNTSRVKGLKSVWFLALMVLFNSCVLQKQPSAEALPCFNAATELRYLRQQPERVDTVLISMCGMDSCVGPDGITLSLVDFLHQFYGMAPAAEASLKPAKQLNCRLRLNGEPKNYPVFKSAGKPQSLWWRTCSGQLFPAKSYDRSGALWNLYEVKHRTSMPDPLQLGRGSVLTYVYRYSDSLKLRQTDTLKLKLSRFDDRVQGRFVRYHGQIQEPGVRYGTVDAPLNDEKTPSVLWLFPDEVCRPKPEGFEGSCRFLWLSQLTLHTWLQSRRLTPSFFGTYSYPVEGTMHLSLEDQRLVHAYPLKLRGASTSVEAIFLQFPGGSVQFLPYTGNPLVLWAATDAARLELISVE